MMRKLLLIFMLLGWLPMAYAYENTYVLIVGINDYMTIGDLPYSIANATAFKDFMMSEGGGSVPAANICVLLDSQATKDNILAQGKALFSKANKNDRAIFYFAGHGGSGLLCPYDCGVNYLYYKEIKSMFKSAQCNTKLMFADACYTGGFKGYHKIPVAGFRKRVNEMKGVSRSKESDFANMNIAVMTATNDDEVGWQTSKYEKGVFTHFLIQGLKGEANSDGNRYITIQELYYYVYRHVTEETEQYDSKQTPQLFGKFNLGLIVGTVAQRH